MGSGDDLSLEQMVYRPSGHKNWCGPEDMLGNSPERGDDLYHNTVQIPIAIALIYMVFLMLKPWSRLGPRD